MQGRREAVFAMACWAASACAANSAPPATQAELVEPSSAASGARPAVVDTTGQVFSASDVAATLTETLGPPSSADVEYSNESSQPELARPAEHDDGLLLGAGARMSTQQPGPSPEVERELSHIATEYQELPALVALPDFLSVNDVLALLPKDDREYLRDELHAQLQNRDQTGRILGTYLDSDQQYFLLWVPDPAGLAQVLAIYDAKGVVLERRTISRGKPLLRNILDLEPEPLAARGYSVAELFIERITTMSVCCLPIVFEIYALTSTGKLRKLLEHPRAHTDVGPGVRWQFLNHFEFTATGLSVSPVVGEGSNTLAVFEYRKDLGRYAPLQNFQQPSKVTTKPPPHALQFAE